MISLETAKRLKELGLRWEPQEGDFLYYHTYGEESELGVINDSDMGENREESLDNIYTGEWIFAPRLDQLLDEIEKRGWDIDLMHFAKNRDNTEISDDPSWSCEINKFLGFVQTDKEPKLIVHQADGTDHAVNVNGQWQENRLNEIFDADSPDEAAAEALIWIYGQEVQS